MSDERPRPESGSHDAAMPSWRLGRVAVLVFALLLGLAFPWASLDGGGMVVAVMAALLGTLGLSWALSRRLVLLAALGVQFLLVYMPGMGDAVSLGLTRAGLTASPESVYEAIAFLILFLLLLGLVSWGARNWLWRVAKPKERSPANEKLIARKTLFGVAVLLAMTTIAALIAGRLSYYGEGAEANPLESGGIRLELFYDSALFLAITFPLLGRVYRPSETTETSKPGRRALWLVWMAGLVLLVFILQSRRVMLICAAIAGLVWLAESRQSRAAARLLRRRVVLLAVMMLLMIIGSNAWRTVGDTGGTTITERLERVFTGVGDVDISQRIDDRLTYLWFDSISRDLAGVRNSPLDIGALLSSSLASVIPRMVWDDKDSITPATCEAAFEPLGIDSDMPCTPQTEGWIAGGLLGFLIAALGWGLTLGIAEALVARGPGLGSVFGLLLFFVLPSLENGVFAWVASIRLAIIGTAIVAAAAFWASVFLRAELPRGRGKASIGLPTRSNR